MNRASQTASNLQFLMDLRRIESPMELSRATGVTQPTIHRILNGQISDPRTKTVQPLADYFGIEVSALKYNDLTQMHEAGEYVGLETPMTKEESEFLEVYRNLTQQQQSEIRETALQKAKSNEQILKELSKKNSKSLT